MDAPQEVPGLEEPDQPSSLAALARLVLPCAYKLSNFQSRMIFRPRMAPSGKSGS